MMIGFPRQEHHVNKEKQMKLLRQSQHSPKSSKSVTPKSRGLHLIATDRTEAKALRSLKSIRQGSAQANSQVIADDPQGVIADVPNAPVVNAVVGIPSLSDEDVALLQRGKTAPPGNAERLQLIREEHSRGHFGRDQIFQQLWDRGFWW